MSEIGGVMVINKCGPFEISKPIDDYSLYIHLLRNQIRTLKVLPDFSQDKCIFIFSDFGGAHKGAKFSTYSFLFCSADKRLVFQDKMAALREHYDLNSPWKELSYKDLKHGGVSRSLEDYLSLVDNFIHGIILTVAIDNSIESVFMGQDRANSKYTKEFFKRIGLGEWSFKEAEKVLRVCHTISAFMSILCYPKQKIIWICDNDSINENAKYRNFTNTQELLMRCIQTYGDFKYNHFAFAKAFKNDSATNDLLSITDFSAGIIQDALSNHYYDLNFDITSGKKSLLKWLSRKSNFLTKLCLVVTQEKNGDFYMNECSFDEPQKN
jgi:hypothetical protein